MPGIVSVTDSTSGRLDVNERSGVKARNDAGEKDLVSVNDGLRQVPTSISSCNGEKIIKTRGVTRIEVVRERMSTKVTWILGLSIFLTSWVAALDATTTYNYQPYATSSFNRHSMLSTLTIANSVIGAVCKPFIAKISDLSSRPVTYFVVLVLYVIGFVITACSPTIAAYVIGSVFIAIGQSGISLMNMVIIADTTTLKWRSFFTSLLSVPYLVTTWISGYIVEDIINSNWRWGYGMFAIITPVALTPAILVMAYLEHQANKTGEIPVGSDPLAKKKVEVTESHISGFKQYLELLKASLIEIDAFGLILLGFAFSLILLPCSLYSYAEGGWNNPSMIAMEVVGGIFLITYVVFEVFFAPFPLLPKRVLMNRTFICCVIIDFIYQMAGYFSLLFFTSYTFVVLNLSYRDWVYLSNTTTMGLCFFGVVWGALFRCFHRYKIFQVVGIAIKLIGMGLYVACSKRDGSPGIGLVVAALVVTNFGDAANVMGTQVAAQAAVPHQDMAATISVLSLYSSIGAAVGTAITSAVWTDKLPGALSKYVPDKEKAAAFFESLTSIWEEPWGSVNREGAINAYQKVNYTLFCMGLGVSSIMFIVALFQTNYYLGDQQNCVEGEQKEDYHHNANGSKKTLLNRAFDFWK
ncbi:BBL_G0016480.mRNA.1.CDS.1 [Saccharomyces cerevisiae]|nr:BBL_G0016480.mRNA.1.CDS.1 [Saccharomyces cerevisiae]CAI7107185.1 BBL_G0016480.mRNA.1.CDS.1 [Saccharomyces cerevisiae]